MGASSAHHRGDSRTGPILCHGADGCFDALGVSRFLDRQMDVLNIFVFFSEIIFPKCRFQLSGLPTGAQLTNIVCGSPCSVLLELYPLPTHHREVGGGIRVTCHASLRSGQGVRGHRSCHPQNVCRGPTSVVV